MSKESNIKSTVQELSYNGEKGVCLFSVFQTE